MFSKGRPGKLKVTDDEYEEESHRPNADGTLFSSQLLLHLKSGILLLEQLSLELIDDILVDLTVILQQMFSTHSHTCNDSTASQKYNAVGASGHFRYPSVWQHLHDESGAMQHKFLFCLMIAKQLRHKPNLHPTLNSTVHEIKACDRISSPSFHTPHCVRAAAFA